MNHDGRILTHKQPPPAHRFDSLSNRGYTHVSHYGRSTAARSTSGEPFVLSRPIDKARAPKLAILLFSVCMLMAGSYHTIYGVDFDHIQPSYKVFSQAYYNHTYNHTKRINELVQEVSLRNVDAEGNPVFLPAQFRNLVDLREKPNKQNTVPIFWHVPRNGGGLIKNTAAYCLDLTQASNVGALLDPELAALDQLTTIVDTYTGAKFLNVDTTSPEGMHGAKMKGDVASYSDLDLIITPYINDAVDIILTEANRGRMFVMMRHPIERAVSMFHFAKLQAEGGVTISDSLLNYAKGHLIENNWMTRFLSNKLGGELTHQDEAIAKEVLRTKALIGLLRRKNESYQRFKDFFGWKINDGDPKKVECEERFLEYGWKSSNYIPIKEDSEEWKLLKKANNFDLRLYEYAEKLFEVQGAFFAGDHIDLLEQEQIVGTVPDSDSTVVIGGVDGVDITTPDGDVIDLIASNLINVNNEDFT